MSDTGTDRRDQDEPPPIPLEDSGPGAEDAEPPPIPPQEDPPASDGGGADNDEADYRHAREQAAAVMGERGLDGAIDAYYAYSDYVEKHPNGRHVEEARLVLERELEYLHTVLYFRQHMEEKNFGPAKEAAREVEEKAKAIPQRAKPILGVGPTHEEVLAEVHRGRERIKGVEAEVAKLLESAKAAEAEGNFAEARQLLAQAEQTYPNREDCRAAMERVRGKIQDDSQPFQLFVKQLSEAVKHFDQKRLRSCRTAVDELAALRDTFQFGASGSGAQQWEKACAALAKLAEKLGAKEAELAELGQRAKEADANGDDKTCRQIAAQAQKLTVEELGFEALLKKGHGAGRAVNKRRLLDVAVIVVVLLLLAGTSIFGFRFFRSWQLKRRLAAALESGDGEAVAAVAAVLEQKYPQSKAYMEGRAAYQAQLAKTKEAFLAEFYAENWEKVKAKSRAADASAVKGRWEQASAEYDAATKLLADTIAGADEAHQKVLFEKAQAEGKQNLENKAWDAAIAAFERAMKVPGCEQDPVTREWLAEARTGKIRSQAVAAFDKAMAEGDESAARGEWDVAVAAYERAVAVKGYENHVTAQARLKETRVKRELAVAEAAYQTAMSQAKTAVEAADWDSAVSAFEAALKADGYAKDPAANKGLCDALIAKGRKLAAAAKSTEGWDQAIAVFERVRQLDPQNTEVSRLIRGTRVDQILAEAGAARAKNQWNAVLDVAGKALEFDPDSQKAKALKAAAEDALRTRVKIVSVVNGQPLAGAEIAINGQLQKQRTPAVFLIQRNRPYRVRLVMAPKDDIWYVPFDQVFRMQGWGEETLKGELKSLRDLVPVADAAYAALDGLADGSQAAQERQRETAVEWKMPLEVQTRRSGIRLRLIPAGSFTMGSSPLEKERTDDEAQIQARFSYPFYMAAYEVTRQQWVRVMGSDRRRFRGVGGDTPVVQVGWADCQEFLQKLCQLEDVEAGAYRLAYEAEWEYACRAGTRTAFCYGDNLDATLANFDGRVPYKRLEDRRNLADATQHRRKTVSVGEFAPNAWGLYDMHGNVSEWCGDWYAPYPAEDVEDYRGPVEGDRRIFRGGCWRHYAKYCRSADRRKDREVHQGDDLGFRMVRVLREESPWPPPPEKEEETKPAEKAAGPSRAKIRKSRGPAPAPAPAEKPAAQPEGEAK
ncbi:MAG: SUMF1/EgtB/PvdO family nonheme iron enzyme [Kiritimatiellae bacterium]|nr:SUMF1/EgtB/PvdO family nonheme iron enzyme [Kiritimatiellia bacterium]